MREPTVTSRAKRWALHGGHGEPATPGPHLLVHGRPSRFEVGNHDEAAFADRTNGMLTLDGSRGEGGGQILRTALTLSMLTGRAFRIVKIRANRDRPGLRAQHLQAVESAAKLCGAELTGASLGSKDLTFRPGDVEARDLSLNIGTAGSTALVLQTLHLPLALRSDRDVRLSLAGGTFNLAAPSFPFLRETWRTRLGEIGLPIHLASPAAGFYPAGAGRLEAWIEPGSPKPLVLTDRGRLLKLRGEAGVLNLRRDIASRLKARVETRLEEFAPEISLTEWQGSGQGTAISLVAEYEHTVSTFVGLGERGKPAEVVADEAIAEWLAFHETSAPVDPHSADQLLLPTVFADGRSEYVVSEVTEHLRTNVATIREFLDREIRIENAAVPRVVVE